MRDTPDAARCAVGVRGYDLAKGHAGAFREVLGPVAVLKHPPGRPLSGGCPYPVSQ